MDFEVLIIVLIVVVFSMVLHEIMHGLVAYWLGDHTAKEEGRLSLNPLKHLDPFMSVILPLLLAMAGGPIFGGAKPVPIDSRNLRFREWGFALVAIAGPLTNLLLAFLGYLVGHFTGVIYQDFGLWSLFTSYFVLVNLGFFVFNMLPIPPLDGSRILYAVAPDFLREFLLRMERWGIMVVFVLMVVFGTALGGFMNSVIVWFVQVFEWIV